MENKPIGELMDIAMSKIKELVDTNVIVGEPIITPDGITIIPISRASFGFGGAGSEWPAKTQKGASGGGGVGVRVEPMGFLVIKDGNIRMLNLTPPAATTLDRAIELVPTIIDRVDEFIDKRKAEKEDYSPR